MLTTGLPRTGQTGAGATGASKKQLPRQQLGEQEAQQWLVVASRLDPFPCDHIRVACQQRDHKVDALKFEPTLGCCKVVPNTIFCHGNTPKQLAR